MDAIQFARGSSRSRFAGTSQVNREAAERTTILRGLVGSTVHGLNVNDGIEDRDEMGICVEPLEEAMALWAPFEVHLPFRRRTRRTPERAQHGRRSRPHNLQPAKV